MSILEGSVVFVDDDYAVDETNAKAFYDELQLGGRPVAAYSDVPPAGHLDHWDGLSLVVLDWNLSESETRVEGVSIPEMASDAKRQALIEFLIALLDRYFCPIFIVSADAPEQIESALRGTSGFPAAVLGRRVQVLQKDDSDLLPKLEKLVADDPVLSTFRVWEQQYQSAKNRMFIDLDVMGTDWLAYYVEAAREGQTDLAHDLVSSLYGNLQHRVDLVAFDVATLKGLALSEDGEAQRAVFHGRSVLPEHRLYKSTIMPGDFFRKWRKTDPDEAIWINITPACYTVLGRGDGEVRLHLIRGLPVPVTEKTPKALRDKRRAQTRSATVDVLLDGKAYKFEFSSLETVAWSKLAKNRLGRLLSPFITDVQQRHAIYLTSEGLPAALPSMYKSAATVSVAP